MPGGVALMRFIIAPAAGAAVAAAASAGQ